MQIEELGYKWPWANWADVRQGDVGTLGGGVMDNGPMYFFLF